MENQLKELQEMLIVQGDFLSILATQICELRASIEATRSAQRIILRRMGMDEKSVKKADDDAFALALALSKKLLEQQLKSLGKSTPESDSQDPERN